MSRKQEIKAYPIYLKKGDGMYAVWNDHIPVTTQGSSLEEALYMAKDAIELMAYDAFCNGDKIPEPDEAIGTDEEYDLENFVLCDLNRYFNLESEHKVKKNCTIPESLAKAAESKNINFSKVLTFALEKELELV